MKKDFRKRNLLTQENYRKDSFWQITFPLMIGSLLILALAVWTVSTAARGGEVGKAADASLVFLIIPALMVALIFLVILAGLVYALIWLNKNIPFYAYQVQIFFARVQGRVQTIADKAAAPVIKTSGLLAALRTLVQVFRFRH